MPNKPTVPEVLPKVRAYYETNPVGGSLHLVLEDGNVRDKDVQFCLEYAISKGDIEGEELAKILLTMSKTQRLKLHELGYYDD